MTRRWLIAACLTCCTGVRAPAQSSAATCAYDVSIERSEPLVLDVKVACRGRAFWGIAAGQDASLDGLREVRSDHGKLTRKGRFFELQASAPAVEFRYQIDLDAIAARQPSPDRALRAGGAVIASASTFLLHPLPLDTETEVSVNVRETPDVHFTTGLERSGDHYRLAAHEIPVATYSVFGRYTTESVALDDGRARVDVVILGHELALPGSAFGAWVRERAAALSAFYGGFPAPRTFVAIVPTVGRSRVHFGKLLPESAPGILLLIGARASAQDLADDWVLLHELFHIGVPSFHKEGKWFDEGLATYYEPILRARAGLLDEELAWRDLRLGMPRGLSAITERGLTQAEDYAGIYWGGAIYCLLADVELRQRSQGRLGLEDGLRRVRARGGHASEVWSLEETLSIADGAFETPLLRELTQRYAVRPTPLELDALFASLGVSLEGDAVTLREDAPLAWVRRAIIRGGAHTDHPARESAAVSGSELPARSEPK